MAMTIDSAGNASVSLSDVSDGTTIELGDFSVGNVGLGSFYVLLGQEEGSPKQAQYTGFTEAGWFSADLSPDYCSPQGSGTFYDDFAADTSLNSDCWSTSGRRHFSTWRHVWQPGGQLFRPRPELHKRDGNDLGRSRWGRLLRPAIHLCLYGTVQFRDDGHRYGLGRQRICRLPGGWC